MLSSVTINCQVTMIVMNSGSQFVRIVLSVSNFTSLQDCLFKCQNCPLSCVEKFSICLLSWMLPAWLEKQKQVGLCIWLDVTYYLPLASDDVIYTLILFPKFHTFYSHHFPPSDNGVYTLVLTSFLFQISLYLIKKYRYVIKSMSRYYHYN